jgi:hypothetical protein
VAFKQIGAAYTRLTGPEPEDNDFVDTAFEAEMAAGAVGAPLWPHTPRASRTHTHSRLACLLL